MMIKPIGDHLVVIPIEEEGHTTSGIYLPESAKGKPQRGKVTAVGPGAFNKQNERIPLDIHVDDTVLFAKYVGTDIKLNGQKYLILQEKDVLALIDA